MTRAELLLFLQKHRLGVQSTVSPSGDPQAAVVGIAITPELEIVFDTVDTTRKCRNLRANPRIAFVIGWDQGITVQLEGNADDRLARSGIGFSTPTSPLIPTAAIDWRGRASPIFACVRRGRATAISTIPKRPSKCSCKNVA